MKKYKIKLLTILIASTLACNIAYSNIFSNLNPINFFGGSSQGLSVRNMTVGAFFGLALCVTVYSFFEMIGWIPDGGNNNGSNGENNILANKRTSTRITDLPPPPLTTPSSQTGLNNQQKKTKKELQEELSYLAKLEEQQKRREEALKQREEELKKQEQEEQEKEEIERELDKIAEVTIKAEEEKKRQALEQLKIIEAARKKREASEVQFRQMGIEEHLIPFVRYARQDGNKMYIQLKTVNQRSDDVVGPVKNHFDTMKQDLLTAFNVENTSDLPVEANDQIEKLNQFHPSATCYSLSVRNVRLLKEFLESPEDIIYLQRLQSAEGARNFLNACVQGDQQTSWGETHQLDRILQNNNLDNEVSTVSSILVDDAGDAYPVAKVKIRAGADRAYHLFILETGDLLGLDFIGRACSADSRLQTADRREIISKEDSATHFYVVGIQKIGEGEQAQFRYYIVDTSLDKNHIAHDTYSVRDTYFAESIIDAIPTQRFRNHLEEKAKESIDIHLRLKERREEKKKKKKQLQELLKKKEEEKQKKNKEKKEIKKN